MKSISKRTAIAFVVLLGIVSLLADMTYEGFRSITGQYLAILGANGSTVGVVIGLGKLISYGFRLVSGYISDRTGKYWFMAFLGYIINLLVVPLLALADNWPLAAALIILERLGKAIRTPARDAMLSYATHQTGRGWGFGLHESLDRIGAILGPLVVTCVLYYQGSYQMSFMALIIPALCALIVLTCAQRIYRHPQDFEIKTPMLTPGYFNKKFWLFIAATSCIAAGYIDFPLFAFHFEKINVVSKIWIPAFFSIAMTAGSLAAIIFGWLYDSKGLSILIFVTMISSFFAPFVFFNGFYSSLVGMVLWGIGIGSQESIIRAVIAQLVHKDKRATAYGILNVWFGVFWFIGSSIMGVLYDISLIYLVLFSLVLQLASIPIFFVVKNIP